MSMILWWAGERGTYHADGERGVRLDVTTIGRELEFDGRHVVDTRNIAHRRGVARATLDLQAVCDGLADTEANEVVSRARLAARSSCEGPRSSLRADEGVRFTGCLTLTIDGLDDGGVQG